MKWAAVFRRSFRHSVGDSSCSCIFYNLVFATFCHEITLLALKILFLLGGLGLPSASGWSERNFWNLALIHSFPCGNKILSLYSATVILLAAATYAAAPCLLSYTHINELKAEQRFVLARLFYVNRRQHACACVWKGGLKKRKTEKNGAGASAA